MAQRCFALPLLAALLACAGGAAAQSTDPFGPYRPSAPPLRSPRPQDYHPSPVGKVAPDFLLRALTDTTDTPPLVRLGQFRGRIVVVNFWTSWCGPCRSEMPRMARVAADYATRAAGEVVFLEVNAGESRERALEGWQRKWTSLVPVYAESDAVLRVYDVWALPTTMVLGRDGVIRQHILGGVSESTLRQAVDRLLATSPTTAPATTTPAGR